MSLPDPNAERLRIWNGLGALVFGDDTGAEVAFNVTNRNGQITIDTRPTTAAPYPVIANIGGYGITLPMLLIGGALGLLAINLLGNRKK